MKKHGETHSRHHTHRNECAGSVRVMDGAQTVTATRPRRRSNLRHSGSAVAAAHLPFGGSEGHHGGCSRINDNKQ